MRMLHDNILVRRLETKDETQGGIILPTEAREHPTIGTIVSLGPLAARHGLAIGDRVTWGKWTVSDALMYTEPGTQDELLILRLKDLELHIS